MRRFFIVIAVSALQMAVLYAGARAARTPDALSILGAMPEQYRKVRDYAATFLKQERVGGNILPQETIRLKFKKPFKVYMRWLEGPHEGREALYVEGENDGKVIGHEGGFFGFVTVRMDRTGRLAMKGNRHPITDVGVGRLMDFVMGDINKGVSAGELRLSEPVTEEAYGRKAYRLDIETPPQKDKGYYARRYELWVDAEYGLPVRVVVYGWEGEFLEAYGYKDIEINPGIPDAEFERSFKGYNF